MSRFTLLEIFLCTLFSSVLLILTYVIMKDYEMVNTEYVDNWYPNGKLSEKVLRGVITREIYEGGFQSIGSNICPNDGEKLKLLIIVESRCHHGVRRQAIRNTWGHFAMRTDVSIGFLMGKLHGFNVAVVTQKEQYFYQDLILNNNIDSYRNSTLKSISMVEFASTYCKKVAYVVKTDDDVFLNVQTLMTYIKTENFSERAIYGRYHPSPEPDRRKYSKHYVSYELYNNASYPKSLLGAGYVFTPSIAKELFNVALNLIYLPLEDVYITGFCAEAIHLPRINVDIFYDMLRVDNSSMLKKLANVHQARPYFIWFFMHRAIALPRRSRNTSKIHSKI